jgi:predicted aldo/keto reductase-like oxidoreductase
MRFLFLALIAVYVASIISNGIGRDADVKLAIHQADTQSKLDEEQRAILTRLEAKKDSRVSEFVQDWRTAYPTASSETLQELRLIEQKTNNDITLVSNFTLAAHQKKADKLNDAISTPFGGKFEARPGI